MYNMQVLIYSKTSLFQQSEYKTDYIKGMPIDHSLETTLMLSVFLSGMILKYYIIKLFNCCNVMPYQVLEEVDGDEYDDIMLLLSATSVVVMQSASR